MPPFESAPDYEHGQTESLGVLLVNLGTPDAPTPAAVRRYLAEFLSDPRVVELPRFLWWLVLHGYILLTRPSRSAKAYAKVWTDSGSPLLIHSQQIADAVQARLAAGLPGDVNVELGMVYGNPSIASALQKLHDGYARRIVVLPLYPQYSNTTTGSVFASVADCLQRRRWIPELRFINHYHDSEGYIASLAASVRDYWQTNGRAGKLLMSFHGVPQKTLTKGDPYHCHCQKTARLLAKELELGEEDWVLSFQSRVGREQWLKPYTDKTLRKLGSSYGGRVDVICPGFAADCLETLEEIAMENNELYQQAGGSELHYIPALNARPDHITFLSKLVAKNIAGWPEASANRNLPEATRKLEKSRARAREMGADN